MTRDDELTLYHFWRSSSSWRVRWALRLKAIDCRFVHVDLATGEAQRPPYLDKSPLGQVPVLEIENNTGTQQLTETVAILEWLDENWPEPTPLMPSDAFRRARARQLVEIVNANIHALQNISVFRRHSPDEAEQAAWNRHWVGRGLQAYEHFARDTAGNYSLGDEITMPDLYLVPICENALRFGVDLAATPTVMRVFETAKSRTDVQASSPEAYEPAAT